MPRYQTLLHALLWLIGSGLALTAYGVSPADAPDSIEQAREELAQLAREVAQATDASDDRLKRLLKEATATRKTATDCIDDAEKTLAKIDSDLRVLRPEAPKEEPVKISPPGGLKDLGLGTSEKEPTTPSSTGETAPPAETPEVVEKRRSLQQKRSGAEKRLASCRLLLLQSQEIMDEISTLQQSVLARHLLARGLSALLVLRANLLNPEAWWEFAKTFARDTSGLKTLNRTHWIGLMVIVLLSGLLAFYTRRRLLAWVDTPEPEQDLTTGLVQAILACLAHYAPYVLLTVAPGGYLTLVMPREEALPFVSIVSLSLFLYFALAMTIRILLSPCKPAQTYLPLPEDLTHALAQRLKVLALLLFVGFLLFTTLLSRSLPDLLFLLVKDVYAAFLVLNLVWVTWLIGRLPRWRSTKGPRVVLSLVLVGALAAEWTGYRNLGSFLLWGIVGTLLALGLAYLLARLLGELFDGLDDGRYGWQRALREKIGLKTGEYIPGLTWLRFLSNLALWGGIGLWILWSWGLSDTGIALVMQYLTEGFDVGKLRIVPIRIFWAIVVFSLLLTFTRWFKQRLGDRWLQKSRIERGAREAIVTISGYIGVAVIVLVAMSMAGIEFTNLAIIAGALSVGIGFGLQNVVNNFVSGLILLFERPIKTGDWIVVAGNEGYVRRISIRSTQIQTFDRSDVIVPNSELISGVVTNWMLSDPWGRVRAPVGVAYGTDTEKVKEILLEIGRGHPLVVTGDLRAPDPRVLFLAFGDSSLNFELRCIIRDIDKKLQVQSDLNFAIDAAFRKHGIVIPFPQRDLHIQDWPSRDAGTPLPPRREGPGNDPRNGS